MNEALRIACETALNYPTDFDRDSIAQHVEFAADGTAEPLSADGRFLIRVCHLNRPLLVEFRRRLRSLLELLAMHSTADGEQLCENF